MAESAGLGRGSRRGIPARGVGHGRRVGESGTVAVDIAAGSTARIPGRRSHPRAIGRRLRGQARQRNLSRTSAQRTVGGEGVILSALVIRMAGRTDELRDQEATINVDLMFARRWRGAVAGCAGRGAGGIHHTRRNAARALVATQTGHMGRPTRKVLAVALLAEAEIEVGLEQKRAVKIGLVWIQNPGRVHRSRFLQRTRLGTSHHRNGHGHR